MKKTKKSQINVIITGKMFYDSIESLLDDKETIQEIADNIRAIGSVLIDYEFEHGGEIVPSV